MTILVFSAEIRTRRRRRSPVGCVPQLTRLVFCTLIVIGVRDIGHSAAVPAAGVPAHDVSLCPLPSSLWVDF